MWRGNLRRCLFAIASQHIRWTLKDQMREKAQTERSEQEMKNLECQIVIQRDRDDLEEEKQKQKHRTRSLLRVTTRNKEVNRRERERETNSTCNFLSLVNGK